MNDQLGYVLAFPDSPEWLKAEARVDGLLCDGTNDELEVEKFYGLLGTSRMPRGTFAPGNAKHIRWSRHPGSSAGWHSAVRPRYRTDGQEVVAATLPGLEHWTVFHTEIQPDASRFNVEGGYHNIFEWIPKHPTGRIRIRGLSYDGHSNDQVRAGQGSRSNHRWSMSGGRDWGATGVVHEKCRWMNWRGTTGGGGPQETGFYDVYGGMLLDCLFVEADGGDCATMSGLMNWTGGRIINCEFRSLKGNINHGCAMWKAIDPVRWGLMVRGRFLSSGVRSEVSQNVIDVDIDVEGTVQMGFVSQCVQGHQVHSLRSVDNGWNNLALNMPRGFKLHSIKGKTAEEKKRNFGHIRTVPGHGDIQFFAHADCPGGIPTPARSDCNADLTVLRERVKMGELRVHQYPLNSFTLAQMGLA